MIQNIIDTLATTAARIEALVHPDAIILPNFIRSIQKNFYSCGAHSVYTILKYYRKRCTTKSVEQQLHTDEDGTAVSDIKRVLKHHRLKYRALRKPGLRELKAAINNGYPVLISLYSGEHYGVFFGYSTSVLFVMNSSLDFTEDGVGSLWCTITNAEFRRAWDRWGIVVSHLK